MSNTLLAPVVPSLLAASLLIGLAACQKAGDSVATGHADRAAQVEAASHRLAGLDSERLRTLAGSAIADRRVHAPASDNAVEYYLALRDQAPQDASISTALVEFQPYVLTAADQALARAQPDEARRLLLLLERIAAQAPALPRLRDALVQLRMTMTAKKAAGREALLAERAEENAGAGAEAERAGIERLAKARAAILPESPPPGVAAAPA